MTLRVAGFSRIADLGIGGAGVGVMRVVLPVGALDSGAAFGAGLIVEGLSLVSITVSSLVVPWITELLLEWTPQLQPRLVRPA